MLLLQALVYLAAGVISVPIAKRLGLGSVLGYLVAGAVIGPSGLSLVGNQQDVMHFAEFGVVILLFLIGLEVRPALLWSLRSSIFGLGGGQLLATVAVVAAAAMALGLDWRAALACGAILAMSSTAIVLPTLDEKGLRKGPVGTASFGVLLFQDLAVIPLFILLPLLAVAGTSGADVSHEAVGGLPFLREAPGWLKAVAAFCAVGLVVAGGRYLVRPLFRYIASAKLREIFTATALLLVVGVAVLMQSVGLSSALGAFLAGVMLAESEFRRELEADVEPFRGLFLGLFFITVGAGLDFALIVSRPLLIIGLVLALMIGKALVMFGVARLFRVAMRDAAATAVALCQGGEFAFVLITFVVGARVLGGEVGRLLAAVVAVSMMLTPVAFWLYERGSAFKRRGGEDDREADREFEDGADVIVAGFGRFGQIAGRLLTANGFRTSVMDASTTQIDLLRRFGRRVNYGDATRLDLLRAAGAEQAKVLVVAIDDREKAIELVETARSSFPHLVVLARAFDRRHAYELLAKGAAHVERETYEGSLNLGRAALEQLGLNGLRAHRAADAFRLYDQSLFDQLRPVWDDEEGYILASRRSNATLERLLAADLEANAHADRTDEAPPTLDPAEARARLDAYSDGPWPWESG